MSKLVHNVSQGQGLYTQGVEVEQTQRISRNDA